MTCRSASILAAAALVVAPLANATASSAASPRATARCAGHKATIVGTRADDHLVGTKRRDVIVGRGGDDVIRGRGKDDILCGGPGDDVLIGGGDRKRYIEWQWYYYGDGLIGGAGNDRIWGDGRRSQSPGVDDVRYRNAPRRIRVRLHRSGRSADGTARGHGRDRLHTIGEVHGSRHADTMRSPSQNTTLYGGPGADRMSGRSLNGEHGDDRLIVRSGGAAGGRGDDSIRASGVDLYLSGNRGDDTIRSKANETSFDGGRGADRLVAERGHNDFHAGPGADTVIGGGGPDLVYDARHGDTVAARRGSDTVHVDAIPHSVGAGPGNDELIAAAVGRSDRQAVDPLVINLHKQRMHRAGTTGTVTGFEYVTGAESIPNTVIGTDTGEQVVGGCRADTIRTRAGNDRIFPNSGNDEVRAAQGTDVIKETEMATECRGGTDDDRFAGGPDVDELRLDRWGNSATPVRVDLSAGTSNSSGNDVLSGLENVRGGNHDAETIIGDDGPNVLRGGQSSGDDLRGRGGDDELWALGGNGRADGGDGTDLCEAATTVNCER